MTRKITFGRLCEYMVQVIIEHKTGYSVRNLNDIRKNHPVTDLLVRGPSEEVSFEVSVKAKDGPTWPSVHGIQNKSQYIVFVDLKHDSDPAFYILSNRQWSAVLRSILPNRDPGGEIIDGAIEWNWEVDGKKKKRRGSYLHPDEIKKYLDKWSVLPGVTK